MSDHLANARLFLVDAKLLDSFLRIRLGIPLARRLGEDLNRVAIDFFAVEQGVADAAGDGHMSAQ